MQTMETMQIQMTVEPKDDGPFGIQQSKMIMPTLPAPATGGSGL